MNTPINDCWKTIGIWGDHSCPKLERHTHCRNCEVFCAAAATLLDREPPSGYSREWTARVAQPREPKRTGLKSIVIFRIGGEWLALPTALFLEVADLRPMHTLPNRPDDIVKGLVNIRGELLISVSMAELLGFEAPPESRKQKQRTVYERLLVLGHQSGRVVFPVNEVHVGHRYHPGELKPVPATVALAAAAYTRGLLLWEERNVGVLDEELLFHTLSRSLHEPG